MKYSFMAEIAASACLESKANQKEFLARKDQFEPFACSLNS